MKKLPEEDRQKIAQQVETFKVIKKLFKYGPQFTLFYFINFLGGETKVRFGGVQMG